MYFNLCVSREKKKEFAISNGYSFVCMFVLPLFMLNRIVPTTLKLFG